MSIDRTVQLRILEELAKVYPQHCNPEDFGFQCDDPVWAANIAYLVDHGLATVKRSDLIGVAARFMLPMITARGLDFLADDGGLSAILGVVTVRFEAETLQALIAGRIQASALAPEDKSKALALLKDLSVDGLKSATTRLVEAGLDQVPALLDWLQALRS